MSKEKFIYNIHTLTYEKVVVPFKTRIWQFFGFFSVVLLSSVIMLIVLYSLYPSPRENDYLGEIDRMKFEYAQLEKKIELMSKVLTNVQQRDANVHRSVFGMDPIDSGIWNGGVGGHDAHPELDAFKYGGESVRSTVEKVDMLSRQLALQSRSLDTIQQMANNQKQMLSSIPCIKPVREDKLQKSMSTLSGFGYRLHPVYKIRKMHEGVDFPACTGTPIQASGDGVVIGAEWHNGLGNCVRISHGYGYETVYGHMSKMMVSKGQKITKGTKIGEVGDTGLSTAPHLHYEVHYKGNPINPINFCMDDLSPQEYQQLVQNSDMASQSLD